MNPSVRTIIYPVRDVGKANALFSAHLGVQPDADQPYYVGFRVGEQDVGLDPNGHKNGMTMPVDYYQVEDMQKALQALLAAGAQVHQEAKDVGGGRLIAIVKDADGNLIGLLQDPK